MPSVSVVIPTYNRASCIGRSIESVLDQSFSDFELIVIDDCSDDNTEQVVGIYSDPRIKYFKSSTNQGGAAARNMGIEVAKGQFIAFQDSDDVWFPDKLEECMKAFSDADGNIGVVFSRYIKRHDGIIYLVPRVTLPKCIPAGCRDIMNTNYIGTPTAVVKTELLRKVGGFDPSMARYQDWEIFIRLSENCDMRYISRPLVQAYVSKDSISSSDQSHLSALLIIYEKNRKRIEADSTLAPIWLCKIADAYMRVGERKKGRRYCWAAHQRYGLNIRVLFLLAMSFSFYGKKYRSAVNLASKIRAYFSQNKVKRALLSEGVDVSAM